MEFSGGFRGKGREELRFIYVNYIIGVILIGFYSLRCYIFWKKELGFVGFFLKVRILFWVRFKFLF